jgi:hypothetical protein
LTESIIDKEPFVVACIPAFNEEASIARVVLMAERFVDPRAHGDALNKRPRSFMVEWSLP